jgi:hypothetical protein
MERGTGKNYFKKASEQTLNEEQRVIAKENLEKQEHETHKEQEIARFNLDIKPVLLRKVGTLLDQGVVSVIESIFEENVRQITEKEGLSKKPEIIKEIIFRNKERADYLGLEEPRSEQFFRYDVLSQEWSGGNYCIDSDLVTSMRSFKKSEDADHLKAEVSFIFNVKQENQSCLRSVVTYTEDGFVDIGKTEKDFSIHYPKILSWPANEEGLVKLAHMFIETIKNRGYYHEYEDHNHQPGD